MHSRWQLSLRLVVAAFTLGANAAAMAAPVDLIFFDSDRTGNSEIWMINPNVTLEPKRITYTPNGRNSWDPKISPDGTKLLFTSDREGLPISGHHYSDIFSFDLARGSVSNLTKSPSVNDFFPTWSPEGQDSIAYVSVPGANQETLYRLPSGGGTPRPLSSPRVFYPSWHPSEDRIAVSSLNGGHFSITEVSANPIPDGPYPESPLIPVFGNHELQPAFSDDGNWLSWAHNGVDLYVSDDDGVNRVALPGIGLWESSPDWSPDSKSLVFNAGPEGGPFNVYIMDVVTEDGDIVQGLPLALTTETSNNGRADWANVSLDSFRAENGSLIEVGGGSGVDGGDALAAFAAFVGKLLEFYAASHGVNIVLTVDLDLFLQLLSKFNLSHLDIRCSPILDKGICPKYAAMTLSPTDIEIIDPQGNVFGKTERGIEGGIYLEEDFFGLGTAQDLILLTDPSQPSGVYTIKVTGETTADVGDTFSLSVFGNGLVTQLIENQPIVAGEVQNFTTFFAPAFVSEPTTLAVFGFGLAGLGWVRRRKAA